MNTRRCVAGAAALLACGLAQAAYTVNITQSGSNVVAQGSGSLNVAALVMNGNGPASPSVRGDMASVLLGPVPTLYETYGGTVVGPTSFGSGGAAGAGSSTGSVAGIIGSVGYVTVPSGYVSGTPLGTSSATWSGATLAGLGLTPGTYTWTWGAGPTADAFTVVISAAPQTQAIPTLSEWGVIGLSSLLALFGLARMRRRRGG
jgi:hypothetical protein